MHTAHDDLDSSVTKGVRNLIGSFDLHCHGSDSHQVVRTREVNVFYDVVDDANVVTIWCQAIQDSQSQGRKECLSVLGGSS